MNFKKYEEYALELEILEINKKSLNLKELERYIELTRLIEEYEDKRSK